ncbi:trypsin-like peptidase [Pontibacter ummariensis]|uniref:Trypsin-like peptidase domain-containing protein n=1 Tax=Pontibacter ummariensis TaxID=1610492 RepID=A0A239G6M7_9BACT|nr:serine protease [Pontibacter ummariensis]PRY11614.1 trypsin-like peptidase [Pontibacter ummariensis]SNS64779.1 Trypsin-like peptidase domain-containing protein [Pontibacter ummariensis]
MLEYRTYEQIERYLNGEMASEEAASFEALLRTDARLAGQVQEHKQLLQTMQKFGQRQSLRQKLNSIHAEMEAQHTPATPSGWKVFWNRHKQTVAVAASVSLLSVFGTLWSVQQLKAPVQQQTARYVELRREVERLKQTQTAIINGIQDATKPEAPRPAAFSGTGFAISDEGFLVTSSHVVEGADSVLIENEAGQKYKVTEVYRDQIHDLSILKITDPSFDRFGKLPYTFKTTETDLGEHVFTLGFPREDIVFGEGALSSLSGFEGDTTSYQISIPLNPGNSGGPLLDDKGNLIGVISGKQAGQEGAAFAVKSAYLLQMINELPETSGVQPLSLPKNNTLSGTNRPQQLKKLKDYVFVVKVYN